MSPTLLQCFCRQFSMSSSQAHLKCLGCLLLFVSRPSLMSVVVTLMTVTASRNWCVQHQQKHNSPGNGDSTVAYDSHAPRQPQQAGQQHNVSLRSCSSLQQHQSYQLLKLPRQCKPASTLMISIGRGCAVGPPKLSQQPHYRITAAAVSTARYVCFLPAIHDTSSMELSDSS